MAGCGLLAVVLSFASDGAGATSFVMMSDEDLAAGAEAIVVGSVTGIDRGSNGGYHTDYAVRIERVLKGEDPGSAVMVRVLGGEAAEDQELRIVGAPRFAVGEQAILFLDRESEGTYRLHQYFLGAFRRVEQPEGAVAARELGEVEEVRIPGRVSSHANAVRDFDGFAEWLAAGSPIEDESRSYLREGEESRLARSESAFTSISNETVRWFEFDRGGYVTYFADRSGIHGSAADVFGMTSRALAAWSGVEGAKVSLRFGGTTTISKGFATSDRLNGVLWNDPFGEVSGTFDCARGGVLAIGGVKRSTSSRSFANGSAYSIVEADVVINDGAGCFFERNGGRDGEEVLGHELGHTLGFGHSKDKAALMWATAKGNGRGCALGADDIAGLYHLYPGAAGLSVQPGALTLSSATYEGVEGSTVTVAVERTGGSTGAASVRLRSRNAIAKAPADYAGFDETLTWLHGDASPKTIAIALSADAAREGGETFKIEMVSAAGAQAGAVQMATVTISDPQAGRAAAGGGGNRIELAADAASVDESKGTVNLTVRRSGAGGPVSVVWRTLDRSAKAGADYVVARGVLRWGKDDVSPKTLTVKLIDDRVAEGREELVVKLLRTSGDTGLGDCVAATIEVHDDDAR
jgi:hypothetical protein